MIFEWSCVGSIPPTGNGLNIIPDAFNTCRFAFRFVVVQDNLLFLCKLKCMGWSAIRQCITQDKTNTAVYHTKYWVKMKRLVINLFTKYLKCFCIIVIVVCSFNIFIYNLHNCTVVAVGNIVKQKLEIKLYITFYNIRCEIPQLQT